MKSLEEAAELEAKKIVCSKCSKYFLNCDLHNEICEEHIKIKNAFIKGANYQRDQYIEINHIKNRDGIIDYLRKQFEAKKEKEYDFTDEDGDGQLLREYIPYDKMEEIVDGLIPLVKQYRKK